MRSLLCSCFVFLKFAFSLRTLDTSRHWGIDQSFDKIIREGLEEVVGSPLLDDQWEQASLFVAFGVLALGAQRVMGLLHT